MGLFSKKKKEPVEENPYANPITPYQQARNDIHQQSVGGPGGPGAPGGLPSNPRMNSFASSTAPPPYQSPSVAGDSGRFGDEKYGSQNGYGKNRYDNDNASAFSANQSRSGGYGGFGDDAGNNELFGGASKRYVPPQQGSNGSPANGSAPFQGRSNRFDDDPSKGSLLGNAQDRYNPLPPTSREEAPAEDDDYGGYGAPRELTGMDVYLFGNSCSHALTQRRGGKRGAGSPRNQGRDQSYQTSRSRGQRANQRSCRQHSQHGCLHGCSYSSPR